MVYRIIIIQNKSYNLYKKILGGSKMKAKRIKVILVAGVSGFVLSTALIGSYFVSKAQTNEYKVLESGIIQESEPQVTKSNEVLMYDDIQTGGTQSNDQNADSRTEDEWIDLATKALDNYFDLDVSNLDAMFSTIQGIEEHDIDGRVTVTFAENLDDIMNTPFFTVILGLKSGTVQEAYDEFSDTIGGKKVVENSVTVDEAKKMAEEFIINKELAKAEDLEYIGGKVNVTESRIHVSFKIDDNKSLSVGIDTYTNEIKSFFIRSLDYANTMLFSTMEDAVG